MTKLAKCCVPLLVATIAALGLFLPRLSLRPMHGDEAVNAVKFGQLLETGEYRYDPAEFHGPSLYYLSLIPARLAGCHTLADLNESILRIVPVFFGLVLVLLPFLLRDALGKKATILSSIFLALSPAVVYYSRYYIHEIPLAAFTLAAIVFSYRYLRRPNIPWALCAGINIALMLATKETAVIALASMLIASALTRYLWPDVQQTKLLFKPVHLIAALSAAVLVYVMLFSSFFSNPSGIADSFRTFRLSFDRAFEGVSHIYPSNHYLRLLVYPTHSSLSFSQIPLLLLALIGLIVALNRPAAVKFANYNFLTFIALYTLVLFTLYSFIPYKTPWCVLSFLTGIIILAAVGAASIITLASTRFSLVIASTAVACVALILAFQSLLANYKLYADSRNPYVYAHPGTDVVTLSNRLEAIASANPDGRKVFIQVICPDADYWPLPWYLRRFPNVGFWNSVDPTVPSAPIIITTPQFEPALVHKLYEVAPPGSRQLYVSLFPRYIELRPLIELRAYVTKDLYDLLRQQPAPIVSDRKPDNDRARAN